MLELANPSNAWNHGTITQNSASFNNTTHIIQNRYKNDGTSDETDSYTALTTSQPFYIDNGTDAYDGSKPFSRTAKILVSFDGSNNIETVSVLDAGAGYTNTNNIAIRAKTGNTFGINDAIDIHANFLTGSILNIELVQKHWVKNMMTVRLLLLTVHCYITWLFKQCKQTSNC